MTTQVNREEDILYAGTDKSIVQTIRENFPAERFLQVTNDQDLVAYLQGKMIIFQLGRSCGASGRQLMALYPKVTLVDPDLPESRDSQKTTPVGPATVAQCKDHLMGYVQAYVLANDKTYADNVNGLRSCCEENKIPVIKESELVQKLQEALK